MHRKARYIFLAPTNFVSEWGERRYELPLSGYPKVNQDLSVCFWGSGDISRPNDDEVIGQCDLIVERDVTQP